MRRYLEQMMIRLAQGVGKLDEELLRFQGDYVLARQNPDGGFSGREGPSDLYYSGFALRSLALLGKLDGEPAKKAANFLQSRLAGETGVVDFLTLIYAGMLLRMSAGLDIFAAAAPSWPQAVSAQLEQFRRADGGYAKTVEGQSSSTYQSFLVAICLQAIEQPLVEPEKLLNFVLSRRRSDGGFVEIGPMRYSGTNPTAAAAGLLNILGSMDLPIQEGVIEFLAERQNEEGGLCANTRIPIADVLSTFTGLLTLADLRSLGEVDRATARSYILEMQHPGGGFRGGLWDDAADVEYTFYGLGSLALLAEEEENR